MPGLKGLKVAIVGLVKSIWWFLDQAWCFKIFNQLNKTVCTLQGCTQETVFVEGYSVSISDFTSP